MTLQEIKDRLAEIENITRESLARLDEEGITDEEVAEIVEENEALEEEKAELEKSLEAEQKKLNDKAAELRKKAISKAAKNAKFIEQEEPPVEKNYTIKSKEYTRAWAKSLMGRTLTDFDKEVIEKAIGDAITTTSDTFVASTADTQGINNGGLFVPTEVILGVFDKVAEESPFFRDIRKLAVNGNVSVPYLSAADEAQWLTEATPTPNEGAEYKSVTLTGCELAKNVVLTWKVEAMTVEGFVEFIIDEINEKMGDAIATAAIYGTGADNAQPYGATYGLTPVTDGSSAIDTVLKTYEALSQKARKGAKVYVSSNVGLALVGYATDDGNYPFINGINQTALFRIEVDPYLKDYDVLAGNARNYIWNTNTPLRIDRESTIKDRHVTYGGYGVFDGAPKGGAFAYGQYSDVVSA